MKNICIIQARTSSTRLPNKVLLPLEHKTVLEHVVLRAKRAKLINEIIIATTKDKEDTKIVSLCEKNRYRIFRGSRDNVLDRYYQAIKLENCDNVIRITSDCPVIDPKIIDAVIKLHIIKKADYTGIDESTVPDGEDVEVFTLNALKESWKNAKLASELEHVTLYIKNNPDKFKIIVWKNNQNLGNKRWTLDEKNDYEFLKIIYKNLYPKNKYFGIKEIVEFVKQNPEIEKINHHINRNEGLKKSLKEDRIVKE